MELLLVGLRSQGRVVHGYCEAFAQQFYPIGRKVRRGDIRSPYGARCQHDIHKASAGLRHFVLFQKLVNGRHVGQSWISLRPVSWFR